MADRAICYVNTEKMKLEEDEEPRYVDMDSETTNPEKCFEDMCRNFQERECPRGILIEDHKDTAKLLLSDINLQNSTCFTIQDVMAVGGSLDLTNVQTELGHMQYLKTTLMLDHETRNRDTKIISGVTRNSCTPGNSGEELSDEDEFFSDNEDEPIHPLDYLILLYLHCNSGLKQLLANAFYLCRLSVPLVVPNYLSEEKVYEIFLSPLANINLTWKKELKTIESPILTAPSHMIGFLRLGSLGAFSKSNLMNNLLDTNVHSTYVHWDSKNGNKTKRVSQGTVEATWYVPTGPDDKLENLTTMLNVRGDCLQLRSHFKLVRDMSHVLVCFIQSENICKPETINTIKAIPFDIPIICIICWASKPDKRDTTVKEFKQTTEIDMRRAKIIHQHPGVNMSDLVKSVMDTLPLCMKGIRVERTLLSLADRSDWCVDRHKSQLELHLVNNIMLDLEKDKLKDIKAKYLPFQGVIWNQISVLEKKLHRKIPDELKKGKESETQIRGKYENEIQQLKQIRTRKLFPPKNLVSKLMVVLRHLRNPTDQSNQFVRLLNQSLNSKCRHELPALYAAYKEKWEDRSDTSIRTPEDETALQQIQQQINDASVGYEHFIREIAHIFETDLFRSKLYSFKQLYPDLPNIVAKSIIQGCSFEVLDGDAGNMPTEWMTAVFTSLKSILGNKNVLVVSVIGVQSSGKSTLLNAMFGLQFPVSAGRCTKGVYLQLVKACHLPFQYVIVIDSEGLRAPELGLNVSKDRDNELATFVLGLGDVTIVNIKGENTAQMKDVIQIAVLALLRMKRVNENYNNKRRCIFVHQNMGAPDAKEKNLVNLKKLQDTLNEIAQEAGKQENMKDIRSFNQIIAFDSTKDVWFFPDLWHGSPPMSFISKQYSSAVLSVRKSIIESVQNFKKHNFKTLDHIQGLVVDLWKAVLDENFVFSFQNVLEIRLYEQLEKQTHECVLMVENELHKWEKDNMHVINIKTISNKELSAKKQEILQSLKNELIKQTEMAMKQFHEFCVTNPNPDIVEQWVPAKTEQLQNELRRNRAKFQCRFSDHFRKLDLMLETLTSEDRLKRELFHKLDKLGKELYSKTNNNEVLEQLFEKLWNEALPTNASRCPENLEIKDTIVTDLRHLLLRLFTSHENIVTKELSKVDLRQDAFFDRSSHLLILNEVEMSDLSISDSGESTLPAHDSDRKHQFSICSEAVVSHVNEILQTTVYEFIEQIDHESKYQTFMLFNQLSQLKSTLDESIDVEGLCVTLLPSVIVKITIKVCKLLSSPLCKLYEKHWTKPAHDVFKEYKNKFFRLFLDIVNHRESEDTIVSFVISALEKLIMDHLLEIIPILVKCCTLEEYRNKESLLFMALRYMADQKDYVAFEKYFDNPKAFIVEMVRDDISSKFQSEKRLEDILSEIDQIVQVAFNHTNLEFFHQQDIPSNIWASQFIVQVQKRLRNAMQTCIIQDFIYLEHQSYKIHHIELFKLRFTSAYNDMKEKVTRLLKSCSLDYLCCGRYYFTDIVEQLWGCKAVCPFCHEPCCLSTENHFRQEKLPHRCFQHRPQAVVDMRDPKSKELRLFSCNYYVAQKSEVYKIPSHKQHKYCNYKKYYRDWHIAERVHMRNSHYWQWFMAKFKTNIANMLHVSPFSVPPEWEQITETQARMSLLILDTTKL